MSTQSVRGRSQRSWGQVAARVAIAVGVVAALLVSPSAHAEEGDAALDPIADAMSQILSRSVSTSEIADGRRALADPTAPDERVASYVRLAEAAGVLDARLGSAVGANHLAGIQLDLEGQLIEVAVTKDSPGLQRRLALRLPSVSTREVQYSVPELQATHELLVDRMPVLAGDGVQIREIRNSIIDNVVLVGVDGDFTAASAAVKSQLSTVHARRVVVEQAPPIALAATVCQTRFECPLGVTVTGTTIPGNLDPVEFRGGVDFRTSTHRCSSGFSARRTSDNYLMNLTAGHCAVNGAAINHQGFGRIGVVTNRRWNATAPVDGEVIRLDNIGTYTWVRNNHVYTDSNKTQDIQSVFPRSGGSQVVNAPLTKEGTTTNGTFGQVDATGVTITCPANTCNPEGFDVVLRNATRARLCSRGGDSGGPIRWGTVAHGIVSLTTTNAGSTCLTAGDITWFSIAGDLETQLGVRIYES